jgi:hypothetical protein
MLLRIGVTIGVVLASGTALAQSGQVDVGKVVRDCVEVVHQTKLGPDESYMASFYRNFDAFYNPATGTVQNNATSVGDQKALFVFQKCMAERGVPLQPATSPK